MEKYFALDGAVVKSMDEINSYDKLKEVVEDMTATKITKYPIWIRSSSNMQRTTRTF